VTPPPPRGAFSTPPPPDTASTTHFRGATVVLPALPTRHAPNDARDAAIADSASSQTAFPAPSILLPHLKTISGNNSKSASALPSYRCSALSLNNLTDESAFIPTKTSKTAKMAPTTTLSNTSLAAQSSSESGVNNNIINNNNNNNNNNINNINNINNRGNSGTSGSSTVSTLRLPSARNDVPSRSFALTSSPRRLSAVGSVGGGGGGGGGGSGMGNHATPTPRQNGASASRTGLGVQQLYEDFGAVQLGPYSQSRGQDRLNMPNKRHSIASHSHYDSTNSTSSIVLPPVNSLSQSQLNSVPNQINGSSPGNRRASPGNRRTSPLHRLASHLPGHAAASGGLGSASMLNGGSGLLNGRVGSSSRVGSSGNVGNYGLYDSVTSTSTQLPMLNGSTSTKDRPHRSTRTLAEGDPGSHRSGDAKRRSNSLRRPSLADSGNGSAASASVGGASAGVASPSAAASSAPHHGTRSGFNAMTPADALKRYGHKMSTFEQTEIRDYKEVYFVGGNAKKPSSVTGDTNNNNNGFDDDKHFYVYVTHDHVAFRYEVLKEIGKGSFGQVLKAYDHKTQQHVALKIMRNEKRFQKQAQEEIKILQFLKSQDKENNLNVVHMNESFTFRNHTCITFELLSMNLYELIKKNGFKGFSLQLVRKFAFSMLQCLDVLHKNKIIHCDMKPENVLLKQQGRSGIKVIDFGSSCYEHQRVYTYIQSRFYRAPEVILGAKYTMSIDMWSFGCILAELLTGYPIFAGEDEGDQLALIMEVLGMPPQHLLDISKRARHFISSKGYPRYCTVTMTSDGTIVLGPGKSKRGKHRGTPGTKDLVKNALRGCDDPLFTDFMQKCLEWDPTRRLTPAQALRHVWIKRHKHQDGNKPKTVANGPASSVAASSGPASSAAAPTRQTQKLDSNGRQEGPARVTRVASGNQMATLASSMGKLTVKNSSGSQGTSRVPSAGQGVNRVPSKTGQASSRPASKGRKSQRRQASTIRSDEEVKRNKRD